MNLKSIWLLALIAGFSASTAQENPRWDDARSKDWPEKCKLISIKSSVDGNEQPAYFYQSETKEARPLIVSLHTWSGGYDQKDTLSWQCIERDYHYIHPHFRGPNKTYEACGSPLALSDIEDAIYYSLQHANVDTNRIHIIGASGGGYATLLAYMKTKHRISSFSAWVPISNLVDWYHESEGRNSKYSRDIAMATTGKDFDKDTYYFDESEARSRSPIFMDTPVQNRMNSKLYIYAGVHDGYTGSVPITHSLNFYNKVVGDFDIMDKEALIPSGEIIELLASRGSSHPNKVQLGGRDIHLHKNYKDKIRVCIFEGGHEMLEDIALNHVED
ncbi:MAG TPA: peptidase [Bacteroides sp.]|nr:peptidase [Bacteroides sp.]